MRRILTVAIVAFMCGILVIPTVDAQSRPGASHRGNTSQTAQRPGRHGGAAKPAGNASRPGATGRPSTTTNNKPSRPAGNNPGKPNDKHHNNPAVAPKPNRPGSTAHRPVENPSAPGRPATAHRPGPSVASRPMPSRPAHLAPPPRPYRPVLPVYTRPRPPRAWRPVAGAPVINGILGIAFGTAFNLSLDYLYGSGYTVSGYGNDMVYLTDVTALNYMWPDATLYYGRSGLTYSQFYYSTPYYDMARYNALYRNFVASYGSPIDYSNTGGRITATWFGSNNGYITLEFGPRTLQAGGSRFFTTLTFGN